MTQGRFSEIGRFVLVGSINFAIDLSVFAVALYVLEIQLIVANTIAYSVATVNSYLMNKYWTFAGRSERNIRASEFVRFVLFNLGGLAISNLTVYLLAEVMPPMIAKLGAVGATFVWNYLTIRRFVFRKDR
jgi:putative flippase GtrA